MSSILEAVNTKMDEMKSAIEASRQQGRGYIRQDVLQAWIQGLRTLLMPLRQEGEDLAHFVPSPNWNDADRVGVILRILVSFEDQIKLRPLVMNHKIAECVVSIRLIVDVHTASLEKFRDDILDNDRRIQLIRH